jgi:hypothetical protein
MAIVLARNVPWSGKQVTGGSQPATAARGLDRVRGPIACALGTIPCGGTNLMQIDSIGKGYQGPLALLPTPAPDRGASATGAALPGGVGGTASGSFHEILAHYDVTQITPREFSELVQKLHESGDISDAEAQELALIRVDLDNSNADPDDPLDLLNFFEQKLKSLEEQWSELQEKAAESTGAPPNREALLGPTRRQLDWIQKFAMIHEAKYAAPVDLVA